MLSEARASIGAHVNASGRSRQPPSGPALGRFRWPPRWGSRPRRALSGHQPSHLKELPDVHRHRACEAPRSFDDRSQHRRGRHCPRLRRPEPRPCRGGDPGRRSAGTRSIRHGPRADGVRFALRLARGRWRAPTAPRDGGSAPESARVVRPRRASRRVGARGRRRCDRARRPGGRRVRQGLSGHRDRPARRPDPGLRGGDRVARLRGHPPAAVDVTARGRAPAWRAVGRHPPLPPAAGPDERGPRLVADGHQPPRLLRDPHLRLRLERRQRPPGRAGPRRPERCSAADGGPRGRPHLDHPGPRRRLDRHAVVVIGRVRGPGAASPADHVVG